jgi:hypothetical protein
MMTSVCLAAMLVSLAGVGCSGGSSQSNFVGTWSSDLTFTSACAGDAGSGMGSNQDLLNIVLGSTTALQSTDTEACTLAYTVSGNTATAVTPHTCMETSTSQDGTSIVSTVVYNSYALTTSDGKTMTITGTMTVTTPEMGSPSLVCNNTITGTAVKETPDGG